MILKMLAGAAVAAALAVAASAATAAPTGSATSVSPVTVTAAPKLKHEPPADATVDVPSDETAQGGIWASVWPRDAYKERTPGRVTLTCDIDRYGLAEWCKVAYEDPEGKGFGAAAMELRPTLKLKPHVGANGPEDALMNIAIVFKPPDPQFDFGSGNVGGSTDGGQASSPSQGFSSVGAPLDRRAISMLNNPVWTTAASYEDVAHAYPAQAGGADGYAVAHCQVERDGRIDGCQVIREDPEKHGFGGAALSLASKFRVAAQWTRAPHGDDVWVDIPFRFPAPGEAQPRVIASPYWVGGFDPAQALKLFPPEAAAKGLTTGHGVARCLVTREGALTDCAPDPADPEGLGFSEAAVQIASTMRMNPWTLDGAPVDGATVHVGVQLNLGSH